MIFGGFNGFNNYMVARPMYGSMYSPVMNMGIPVANSFEPPQYFSSPYIESLLTPNCPTMPFVNQFGGQFDGSMMPFGSMYPTTLPYGCYPGNRVNEILDLGLNIGFMALAAKFLGNMFGGSNNQVASRQVQAPVQNQVQPKTIQPPVTVQPPAMIPYGAPEQKQAAPEVQQAPQPVAPKVEQPKTPKIQEQQPAPEVETLEPSFKQTEPQASEQVIEPGFDNKTEINKNNVEEKPVEKSETAPAEAAPVEKAPTAPVDINAATKKAVKYLKENLREIEKPVANGERIVGHKQDDIVEDKELYDIKEELKNPDSEKYNPEIAAGLEQIFNRRRQLMFIVNSANLSDKKTFDHKKIDKAIESCQNDNAKSCKSLTNNLDVDWLGLQVGDLNGLETKLAKKGATLDKVADELQAQYSELFGIENDKKVFDSFVLNKQKSILQAQDAAKTIPSIVKEKEKQAAKAKKEDDAKLKEYLKTIDKLTTSMGKKVAGSAFSYKPNGSSDFEAVKKILADATGMELKIDSSQSVVEQLREKNSGFKELEFNETTDPGLLEDLPAGAIVVWDKCTENCDPSSTDKVVGSDISAEGHISITAGNSEEISNEGKRRQKSPDNRKFRVFIPEDMGEQFLPSTINSALKK